MAAGAGERAAMNRARVSSAQLQFHKMHVAGRWRRQHSNADALTATELDTYKCLRRSILCCVFFITILKNFLYSKVTGNVATPPGSHRISVQHVCGPFLCGFDSNAQHPQLTFGGLPSVTRATLHTQMTRKCPGGPSSMTHW